MGCVKKTDRSPKDKFNFKKCMQCNVLEAERSCNALLGTLVGVIILILTVTITWLSRRREKREQEAARLRVS